MDKLLVVGDAARQISKTLSENGKPVLATRRVHAGQHAILTTQNDDYYVLFKRAPYLDYGREIGDDNGAGETINNHTLQAILSNPRIKLLLFAYPNGTVYGIPPREFNAHATSHLTKRTGETALCVQMKQLKPLNEALLCQP
jgi:hypothetical protein